VAGIAVAVCYDYFFFILLYNAEPQIGYAEGLDHAGAFQFNVLSVGMLEQAETSAEKYGH